VKSWLLMGGAFLAVLAGIDGVITAVEWWGGPPACSGSDGLPCSVAPPPLGASAVPYLAVGVALIAVAAVLVWLAVRVRRGVAQRREPTSRPVGS